MTCNRCGRRTSNRRHCVECAQQIRREERDQLAAAGELSFQTHHVCFECGASSDEVDGDYVDEEPGKWVCDDCREPKLVTDGGLSSHNEAVKRSGEEIPEPSDEHQQWVLEKTTAYTETEPDSRQGEQATVWTSKRRLKSEAVKTDTIEKDEIADVVAYLHLEGAVISWHGLLAPAHVSHLRAIIETEHNCEVVRDTLVDRCERLLERKGEPITDGGTPVWESSDRSSLRKSMDTLFPQEHSDECRVCAEPVVDGRWSYCSERCREIANAVQSMFIWDHVREQVLERDDRTCQDCGLSYGMAKRAYWQVEERIDELTEQLHPKKSDHPACSYDRWRRARRELNARYGVIEFTNGAFHVDHITPISQGGHPFDERNLQTLCRGCHRKKTAKENSGPDRPTQKITLDDYIVADGGDRVD